MRTKQRLFLGLVMAAATLGATQNVVINEVINADSGNPPGLPNSGIAQGSIFRIWGGALGPQTFQIACSPFLLSLAGTSIKITVANDTLPVSRYFTSYWQVAGVMPSNTPVGSGILTLTYNGMSASSAITVVPATFGISHGDVKHEGGGGWIVRKIAAVTFPDFQYVTDTNTAKPGDTLILWGTGLGATPNNDGDSGPAPAANIGSAPRIFVGGVQSPSVAYWGRSPNSIPGLDQINFVVPENAPLGCNVSIVVQTGPPVIVSNAPTIALAATDSATYSDPTQTLPDSFFGKTGLKTIFLSLRQSANVRRNADGTNTTTILNSASVWFYQFTHGLTMGPDNTFQPSFGNCYAGTDLVGTGMPDLPAVRLDAGESVTLTPPSGNALTLDTTVPGIYGTSGTSPTFPGGTWTFSNGAGGSGVPPLRISFPVPQPVTWTNAADLAGSTIDKSKPLTITWSGGDSNGYVLIDGGYFACTAPTAAGQFTIPTSILLGVGPVPVNIRVSTVAFPPIVGAVPGIDAAVETSLFATTALGVAFK